MYVCLHVCMHYVCMHVCMYTGMYFVVQATKAFERTLELDPQSDQALVALAIMTFNSQLVLYHKTGEFVLAETDGPLGTRTPPSLPLFILLLRGPYNTGRGLPPFPCWARALAPAFAALGQRPPYCSRPCGAIVAALRSTERSGLSTCKDDRCSSSSIAASSNSG